MQLNCCFDLGMKFFAKRAYQLLNSMFQIDDIHVMGAFLHPNYKTLRSTTSTQIDDCHQACRMVITTNAEYDITEECIEEPPSKKPKIFLESLMDHNRITKKKNVKAAKDEVDRYLELDLQDETYLSPLDFWKKYESKFPSLSRLAKRYFAIPCSSAAVESEFSAAGQIITQRRSSLEPSTVNDILLLRSIENNKMKI
jgi:hypothetical protein